MKKKTLSILSLCIALFAAFGCNRRPMPAVDHPEHDVAHIVVSGIRGGQRHWRRRAGRQDRGLPRTTIRVLILDSVLVIYKSFFMYG